MNEQKYEVELIELDEFKILYMKGKPSRLEANVIFDRDDISQKLIFTIMEISHNHGFGCSPPLFDGPDNSSMIFLVGTILPSERSLKKYILKLHKCLKDIRIFSEDFIDQLDFSLLDLTMFGEMDITGFYPEHIAAMKDQNYNGSWNEFYNAMLFEDREEEADTIQKCIKFEEINNKDIGLIGHKLGYTLHSLELSQAENNGIKN